MSSKVGRSKKTYMFADGYKYISLKTRQLQRYLISKKLELFDNDEIYGIKCEDSMIEQHVGINKKKEHINNNHFFDRYKDRN